MGKKHFTCKSEAQKKAIRASYAKRAAEKKRQQQAQQPVSEQPTAKPQFPDKYPFWARFKPNKARTTLVIDEVQVKPLDSDEVVDNFVHREAIHCTDDNKYVLSGDYERIYPNPDKDDPLPMYLKRPHKHPKKLFIPHNKPLTMPEDLRLRYDKNNYKDEFLDNDDGD